MNLRVPRSLCHSAFLAKNFFAGLPEQCCNFNSFIVILNNGMIDTKKIRIWQILNKKRVLVLLKVHCVI